MQQSVKKSSALLKWGIALLITALSLLSAKDIHLGENALDLLPGDAVRGDLELLQHLGLPDRVFISLEVKPSNGPDARKEAGEALATSVEQVGSALVDSPFFRDVVYKLPDGYEWSLLDRLWPYLPALLSDKDLMWIKSRLTQDGLHRALFEDFVLLNSLAGLPLKEQICRDPLGLSRLFLERLSGLRGEFAITVRNGLFFSKDGRSCLIWGESLLPLTDSKAAEQVWSDIQEALQNGLIQGVKARVVGALPHTLANARTIQRDLCRLLPLATLALIVLFLLVLRDRRALLVVSIPFLAAPVAIAILGLLYREVSAMALGFGIVLLGISVDFAIHLYLALSRESASVDAILKGLRRPIVMATSTTLGVFFVLLFSQVPSHRQMAVLAITGISVAVILTWVLVPTVAVKRSKVKGQGGKSVVSSLLLSFFTFHLSPPRHSALKLTAWGVLLVAGVLVWPELRFNGDLRALDVPDPQISADEARFRAVWGPSGEQAFVVASGRDLPQALERNDQVYQGLHSHSISALRTLSPLLPGPTIQARNIARWNIFRADHLNGLAQDLDRIGSDIGFAPKAFSPFLQWLAAEPSPLEPDILLEGPIGPVLKSMVRLPEDRGLKSQDSDGQDVLITTIVPDTPETRSVLEELEIGISGVKVLSGSKWREQVEILLRCDVTRLCLIAGVVIVCLTGFFFQRPRPVFAALAPVISALCAMAVLDFLTTRDLNLMHVLMGIMVIGLSVDYGIFVVCALQGPVSRTTLLAVSMCALSTLTGFGVLTLAEHPALHTLGTTVLAGIGAAWPTALWITPILMGPHRKAVV